ncbi:Transcription factor iws1 [Tulasnella sp. JGI-2019a]|nr:Transcription factor iws1 [Tulasnella sp. JGI-2019a]KAG9010475.1 Transcription factor iws1 [Tulasnella sp. JGI-2019a]KAG9039891.1 Transcription factor iws1 [Tulasnella sp. JGI-2019a]
MPAKGLERDIFGGSSDSDLSDDDEIRVRNKHAPGQRPPIDDQSGSEDNYVDTERKKGPKFKKRAPREEGEGDAAKPKKRKKRRRPSQEVEDPQVQLDPDQMRRLELSQKIDAIIKPNKSRPKKRKKDETEEILDRYADEEVVRLRDEMAQAADADYQANVEKRPATAKLRMLPEVMEVLQKSSLQQSIFDNNLLEGVRKWLEPLPDKSLPALNIQNAFFEALPKLDIDTNTLKDSGLGKIVLFYTRCKRVTPPIKRAAENLIDVWSRPIIKRSSSYRDRLIPMAAAAEGSQQPSKPPKLSTILARVSADDKQRIRKNAVRIPERDFGTYTVAPRPNLPLTGPGAVNSQVEIEKRRVQQDRLRKMTRKLALHKQKNSRM